MILLSGKPSIYLDSSGSLNCWVWSSRAMTMECSSAGLSIWRRPLPLIKIFQLVGFNDTSDLISCSDKVKFDQIKLDSNKKENNLVRISPKKCATYTTKVFLSLIVFLYSCFYWALKKCKQISYNV